MICETDGGEMCALIRMDIGFLETDFLLIHFVSLICSSLGMNRTMCKYSQMHSPSPPPPTCIPGAGERVVRLQSHPITSDPCRSTQKPTPLDKTHSADIVTHTHTCLRQFISMQMSIWTSSGRSSWQTAFSLLYHMEDLDCIVSSRAEPSSDEYIQCAACSN